MDNPDENGGPHSADQPANWRYGLAVAFAWAWIFASVGAGISGDHTYIPLPKKIAITMGGVVTAALLLAVGIRGTAFTLFAMFAGLEIFVMFIWN